MKNHDYAESARACVRKYVEQNEQLIRSWLEGSGTVEDVGAELILSEVERYNPTANLICGIAGPITDKITEGAW